MYYCVYETDEEYKARMVVNILKKRKIKTFCKNLGIQNLFGDSKMFTGMDLIVGEVKVYVEGKNYGRAKKIIKNSIFLEKKFKTIENDEIQMEKYKIQRSLMFSITSLLILPFFYNMEYIIFCFRKKISVRYIILILNISYLLFSIMLCINNPEYLKSIWKWNFFIILAFSIGKGIELKKKKSKLSDFMSIPIILLISSYIIAEIFFDIRIFE